MSGLDISGGVLSVTNGSRVPLKTDRRNVTLVPAGYSYIGTLTLVFPDVNKDWAALWAWRTQYNGSTRINYNEGQTFITALAQEWSDEAILAAVPAGINFTAVKVRINRTVAPTHDWNLATIGVRPVQNVWIPYSGSILLEAQLCFARAFSLYISGGNLVRHMQQSVGAPPGGIMAYSAWQGGADPVAAGAMFGDGTNYNVTVFDQSNVGGLFVYNAQNGMPIFAPRESPWFKETTQTVSDPLGVGAYPTPTTHRLDGGDPPSTSMPATSYASTYTVDIAAQFGRAA